MAHDFVTCHELKQKIYIFIYKNWYIKFIYIKDYIYIYKYKYIYIYIFIKIFKILKTFKINAKSLKFKTIFSKEY